MPRLGTVYHQHITPPRPYSSRTPFISNLCCVTYGVPDITDILYKYDSVIYVVIINIPFYDTRE